MAANWNNTERSPRADSRPRIRTAHIGAAALSRGTLHIRWRLAIYLAALVLALGASSAAKAASPDEILRRLADDLTEAVRSDTELQNPYSERMAELMQKRVAPRFNFEMITRSVIGKNWIKATADERRTLVSQFRQLMIRSYAKAIAKLKDFDIEVQSVKVVSPNESVIVRTRMMGLPQSYQIDYDMTADERGWRVLDITFEGVSLVNSYRDEFNSLIANDGIQGLIAELEQKNSQ